MSQWWWMASRTRRQIQTSDAAGWAGRGWVCISSMKDLGLILRTTGTLSRGLVSKWPMKNGRQSDSEKQLGKPSDFKGNETSMLKRHLHSHIIGLFTVAKKWKQTHCPLMNEQIKKMWYTYTMEHFSGKTEGKLAICDSKDGAADSMLKAVIQAQEDTSCDLIVFFNQILSVHFRYT